MNTVQLCRRIGVSPRQIQWWCDRSVIRCGYTDRGGSRRFDEAQVLGAAIVADLRRKGVTPGRVRKLRIGKPQGDYLVVNGASHVWCSEEQLIPCVAEAAGGCLVVSVKDL